MMLVDLHDSIRTLLHEHGRIDQQEVDIRFDSPTPEMVQRLVRPTISFFLFELHENTDLRQNSFQSTRSNGHAERRLAPRRVDLHYMVSVLTTDSDDEHLLLWRTLATLMKFHEIPSGALSEEFQRTDVPVVTRTAQPDDMGRTGEVWNGLGVEPRPSIVYVVTAPLDLEVTIQAPLVLTRTTRYSPTTDPTQVDSSHHIGGVVQDSDGGPVAGVIVAIEGRATDGCVTDASGQFVLTHVPEGPVTLSVTPRDGTGTSATFEVPADTYDIVIK